MMTLYLENPQESIKKLLELIQVFSKVAQYKIKYKSVVFVNTHNELQKREILKTIPIAAASKRIPRNKLTKEVKSLYSTND